MQIVAVEDIAGAEDNPVHFPAEQLGDIASLERVVEIAAEAAIADHTFHRLANNKAAAGIADSRSGYRRAHQS